MPKVIIEIGKGQNADQILASLKAQLGGVADSVSLVSENTKRLEKEQRRAEYAFRSTAASLDPAIAKSQEYAHSQKALDEALKRNIIDQQEYNRLLGLAKERHDETSGGLSDLISKYGSGATVVAAFAAALAGSLVVLDQVQQFISASISSAAEAERMQAQIDARIASTGGAAELTASQLADMANELQNLSKFDDEGLASAQNVLLTFTSISGDTFREALSVVTDMSTALGTDLATNARMVGKALEDPVKGLSAMSRAGVVFTTGQKELIQSLVESGDLLGAQDLILASLSERFGGAAAADVATFGGSIDRVNNLWDNFQEKVGEGVLPILSSFLTNVGNIIAGNDELAETLGVLVTKGGEMAMAFVSGSAIAAEGFLKMASVVMAGMAGMADGAADLAELAQLDTLAEGLRKAAAGQRENQQIALALADASGQVATAAFLAATNLGKKGEAARAGAKDSRDHAAADEEAAKAAEQFAKELQGVMDSLDPTGKELREIWEKIDILNQAIATGSSERLPEYIAALAELQRQLQAVYADAQLVANTIPLIDLAPRGLPVEDRPMTGGSLTIEATETAASRYEEAMTEANGQLADNFEGAMKGAIGAAWTEFRETGEVNIADLGQILMDTLLDAALQYFIEMAANQAKLKMSSGATSGGGGGGMSGMGWFAVAAVAIEAYAAHIAASDKKDYQDISTRTVGISGGNVYAEQTLQQGGEIEAGYKDELLDAMNAYLEAFNEVTGNFITSMGGFSVKVREDGEEFRVDFAGEIVGYFATLEEAMMEGIRAAFKAEDFAGTLDPILRQVVDNYQGDAEEFLSSIEEVRGILDSVSGLSDIEIALRDMPSQSQAFESRLVSLGVSLGDAALLTAKWTAQQLQHNRDQITGHEQTEAEWMEQKQREAAMFNATLALEEAKLAAEEANLLNDQTILEAKVALMEAGAAAQLEILNAELAALRQVREIYSQVAPIDPGEIRRRGGRGGGFGRGGGQANVDSGPSDEEQRAISFADFMRNQGLAALSAYRAGMVEMNAAFDEQLEAAREVEGGEESLAEARRAAAAQLRDDLIDSLGLPMEAVRDRAAAISEAMGDFYLSNVELQRQFDAGEITQEEFAEAVRRSREVMGEFGSMMRAELQNLALYFTDAMGDTEESARIRAELAELEWDFNRAQMRFMLEAIREIPGALSDEEYQHWLDFLNTLPENRPSIPEPVEQENPNQGGGYNSGQDDALEAQRDLIAALEDLADLQRDLWASNLSPLNAEEQAQFLAGQLQDAYNQAQASGSAEDVRAFQDLVRDYLSSYQDAYGSTGGYTAEFLRINDLINNLLAMGDIGGIVPGPGILGGPAGTGTGGWRPTPGASGTVLPFERTGGPGSPLVVESPALNALATLTQESNRRLEALERRLAMLTAETERGNQQAASRAFLNRSTDGMVGFSGTPRISRRGA